MDPTRREAGGVHDCGDNGVYEVLNYLSAVSAAIGDFVCLLCE